MSSHRSALMLVVVAAVVLSSVPQFGFADETTTTAETTTVGTATTAGNATPTAAEIRANAVAASRNVGTYRVTAVINRTISTSRINRTVNITAEGVFNRTAREFRSNQTTRSPTRTVAVTTYLVDDSLYVQSDAFLRQYSSKWVTTDLSGDVARRWQLFDTLTRQRVVLTNSSVTRVGTATLDGTETYVLRADVNETTYARALTGQFTERTVDVTNASFTFWIAEETGRIVQSRGTVRSTTTLRGQPVTITERLQIRFGAYNETVSVTLPDAAATAVRLGNRTTTTQRRHRTAAVPPGR